MSQEIEVIVNDQVLLKFERKPRLAGKQRQFLDNMDDDMNQGIDLAGEPCAKPTDFQKVQYVAMQLMQALDAENESMVAICCAYLGVREPGLNAIKTVMHGDEIRMELVFD